jgi:hypothetical protein
MSLDSLEQTVWVDVSLLCLACEHELLPVKNISLSPMSDLSVPMEVRPCLTYPKKLIV